MGTKLARRAPRLLVDYNNSEWWELIMMLVMKMAMIRMVRWVLGKKDGESGKRHPCSAVTDRVGKYDEILLNRKIR